MSDHTDELLTLVKDSASDILSDHLPNGTIVKGTDVQLVDGGDDDGATYGTFRIVVNDGQFYVDIEANAVFQSVQDCWDSSSESHFTKDVYFDELQDFEYEVKRVVEVGGGPNVTRDN